MVADFSNMFSLGKSRWHHDIYIRFVAYLSPAAKYRNNKKCLLISAKAQHLDKKGILIGLPFTTNLPAGSIVMQIHQTPGIPFDFARIEKLPCEFDAEVNVNRTAAPFPRLLMWIEMLSVRHVMAIVGIAAAQRNVTACTSGCYSVYGTGTRNGIGECCLARACILLRRPANLLSLNDRIMLNNNNNN